MLFVNQQFFLFLPYFLGPSWVWFIHHCNSCYCIKGITQFWCCRIRTRGSRACYQQHWESLHMSFRTRGKQTGINLERFQLFVGFINFIHNGLHTAGKSPKQSRKTVTSWNSGKKQEAGQKKKKEKIGTWRPKAGTIKELVEQIKIDLDVTVTG